MMLLLSGLLLLLSYSFPSSCHGLILSDKPVSQLLKQYATEIQQLQSAAVAAAGDDAADNDPVFYLRHCLETDDPQERLGRLKDTMAWRTGDGKSVCEAAKAAVAEATKGGGWNNQAVLDAAPYSARIQSVLTPVNVITTTLDNQDLVYCIRAGQIDDNKLLAQVSIQQLVEFFVYAKEVHHLVANARSLKTDTLWSVITANDLASVKLLGGSADFRQALSQSSKLTSKLFPSLSGPTLLLNLPMLVSALVKLFTPLFPPSVTKRLKFAEAPCFATVASLKEVVPGAPRRQDFEQELRSILQK